MTDSTSNKTASTSNFGLQDVEVMESRECYSGFLGIRRLQLRHRLYAGGWSGPVTREIVQRTPGVGVLLYDPELDMVLLVEQFRVGCLDSPGGPWKLELVAGLIDKDETPQQVAIRETKEEADVDVGNLLRICEYYLSPGSSTEYMHLFCARFDAKKVAEKTRDVFGLDEENEDIRSVLMSRKDADKAVAAGDIDNAMSIIALQWLSVNLDTVRKQLAS